MTITGMERLRIALRDGADPLAASVSDEPAPQNGWRDHAAAAAAGPRVVEHRATVELAVAAVREGYELHYGQPRALRIDDADFALLAGDRLYALGLSSLAAAGDLVAIAELADIISLSAQAHASADLELADVAWEAGASAIGWGREAADS